jgi:hypothetical protein
MGGRRDELVRWRWPCETAAVGVCNGQGESARVRASNDAGEQGVGRAERSVWTDRDARFVSLPLKTLHGEILAQC